MKINKNIAALGLCFAAAAGAFAGSGTQANPTVVYLTGSTAFRKQVFYALRDLGLSSNSAAANNGNNFTWTGQIHNLPDGSLTGSPGAGAINDWVTIYCSWSGSVGGIDTLVNGSAPSFGYVTINNGVQPTPPQKADYSFSDVFQATAPANEQSVTLDELQDQHVGSGAGIAVQPFAFAISQAGVGHISNITSEQVNNLWSGGSVPLSFFTGVQTDHSTTIYATGRSTDSGTRLGALSEVGFNYGNPVVQYEDGGASGWSADPVGNSGYTSGGGVQGALDDTANTQIAIGYLGLADSQNLAHGSVITFNGLSIGSHSAWNLTAVANGQYPYWTYEHLFVGQNINEASDDSFLNVMPGLVVAVDYEINNPANYGSVPTALTLSGMNCNRGADGGPISEGH